MIVFKFIPALVLSIFCLTGCNGQSNKAPSKSYTGKVAYTDIQQYRKAFWDSLPRPTGWTNDYEGLFSISEERKLDSMIAAFEKESTTEICVVTLDTICISKEKFYVLANHIANTWGVGKKGKNNGITICISKGYKRIRICNGSGIGKLLSNEETDKIMHRYFVTAFLKDEYFQGTLDGLQALIETLRQKSK